MREIDTSTIQPGQFGAEETYWLYNGLDCCVTAEVFDVIEPQLDNITRSTYEFAKSLQAPVLDMKLRGVLVDQRQRARVLADYEEKVRVLEYNLAQLVCEGVGFRKVPASFDNPRPNEFNWRSPAQIKELFYGVMRIPAVTKRGSVTADREALEKIENYFIAGPIVRHLLILRDLGKKIGVLKTGIDDDGRMRTSYNIAGTETGRFSSNISDFGTGTNLQNIEDSLRSILVADPGYKFAYIDLEQAESRAVGAIAWNVFHRGAYLDACESGDLHTTVTRLSRPGLAWTNDPKLDRDIADGLGYRHLSMRDLSKKLGHGTNYYGQPATMARHSKLPVPVIKDFQDAYFGAFPEISMWHQHVAQALRNEGYLVSLSRRRRWFFGRRTDQSTLREAIAFDPQGSVGDILNLGMLEVWRLGICQLLLQVHDAILIQYRERDEATVLPIVQEALVRPIELAHGRRLVIPCDCAVGWNFSKFDSEKNPDGLKKYKGTDTRRRQSFPSTSKLDFVMG